VTGLAGSRYVVDDLIDGETYYWTIIPKTPDEVGICSSGIWSFKIDMDVYYPTVELLRPENGSIVNSAKPTFAWSVEYYGTETLSYDVYLDTRPDPIDFEQSSNPYFLPSTLLEDNKTYYWKVVPWAGNIQGLESELWSFTVKEDYTPYFELELKVEPVGIVIEPASIKMINAFVTNKGELIDKISLDIELPQDSNMGGMVNEPSILETDPGDTANFSIMLTTTQNIEPGEVIITVVATSGKALDYEINYEVELKLKVIVYVEEESEPEKSSELWYIWSILIIVIAIILALIFLILFRRKKKEVMPEEETDTLKPLETHLPEPVQEKIQETQHVPEQPIETQTINEDEQEE
jgi:hypothetical protein